MLFTLSPAPMAEGYGETLLPLAAAKAHLGGVDDGDDDLIVALRDASIDMVQQYTSLRLLRTRNMQATFGGFEPAMFVGVGPKATIDVTAVSYVDLTGSLAFLYVGEDWQIGAGGRLLPAVGKTWPCTAGQVTVTFVAGYEEGECPPSLIAAVRLMLGHLYRNREAVVANGATGELPLGVTTLCNLYRVYA